MSKRVGLSRLKRKPNSVQNNQKVKQKLDNKSEKKPLSELFSDIDLTDVSIIGKINDFNGNNTSFKFSSTILIPNEENKDNDESNNDPNKSNSFQCFSKSFVNINQNNNTISDKIESNNSLNNSKSFTSRNDDNLNGSKQSNKRKICSGLFEDFDLSDLNSDHNFSHDYRSALKVLKTTDDCIESHQIDLISTSNNNKSDPKDNDLNKCLDDIKDPKLCSTSSPKLDLPEEEFSFDSLEDEYFLECAEKFGQTANEDKNIVNGPEVNEEKTSVNEEIKQINAGENENSDNENGLPFILRSDYCTYGEEKFDSGNFDNNSNVNFDSIESKQFIGFRKGNGQPLIITETHRIKARELFEDIEELLLNDINKARLELKNSDSCDEKIATNLNNSNGENVFDENMCSKYKSDQNKSTEATVTCWPTSEFVSTSYQFEPVKCCPLNESIGKECKTSLLDNSKKEAMIPCTSTPKSCTSRKKVKFEPNKSKSFVSKLEDL